MLAQKGKGDMGKTDRPADIIFDDLADPQLTRLQKPALNSAKNKNFTFTQEAVLNATMAQTGLSDFGPRPFHEALQVLLDCYASDPQMSGMGKQQVFGDLVRCASNHLIIHDRRRP